MVNLVIGATGLLGTHVLIELVRRGEPVRAVKRANSSLKNVESVFKFYFGEQAPAELSKIQWVQADVLDVPSLQDAMSGCKVVYHSAAVVSFRRRDFSKLIKVNKEGTANVVNVALSLGIDHLVYVSSTAAIGRAVSKDMYDETDKWVSSPENTGYAVSKYLAENEVWRGVEEGLPAVIVNPSVILGPGNWNESSVSIFKVVRKGLRFYTPGANAFVDARDVAFLMAELSSKRIFNDRFLVIGENVSYRFLFEKIAGAFGVKPPSIEAKPWMAGLVWRLESFLALFGRKQNITRETARTAMKTVQYSNQKICEKLGFRFHTLNETVDNTVRYFKSQKLN